MKVNLEFTVDTLAPFSLLEKSPRCLIEKMPRVDTLVQCEEGIYRFITKPFRVKGLPSFIGHGTLELIQEQSGSIHIVNSTKGVLPTDNCSIEARAFNKNDCICINGRIEIEHPLLNRITARLVKPAFDRIRNEMTAEFEYNINNLVANNELQFH